MSKSIKLKDNNYWDSKGIVHNQELLSNILSNLSKKYQTKILSNYNAWSGTTNKVTIPSTHYGFYLVISMTPFRNWSMYLLFVLNSELKAIKISADISTTFSINGKELSITMDSASYWVSFVLPLGTVT